MCSLVVYELIGYALNMDYTDKEIMKKFGKNLKFYRNKARLTQDQLSELCNCSKQTVSGAETGYSFPASKTLFSFSRALNVPLVYLFNFGDVEDIDKREANLLLYDYLDKLPARQRIVLLKILQSTTKNM